MTRASGRLSKGVCKHLRFHRAIGIALYLLMPVVGIKAHAAAPEAGLKFLQSLDQRVADISWRIAVANAPICPERSNSIGISLHDAAQYAPTHRKAAIDSFGFGDGLPAVLAIARDGPAYAAGLRAGDRIFALDGEPAMPNLPRRDAPENYASVDALTSRLERLPAGRPVQMEIRRGDRAMTLAIEPATICRSRVEVVPGGQVNANSNGTVVQIYGKLALWTRNEDELAIVIAHEMAHNLLGHNRRIAEERIGTGIFAALGGDGRKLRAMEREADRYGLYLAARAGYDYHIAPEFWSRLAGTSGLGAIWATTHPTAGDRARLNRETANEIARKAASGGALTP